MSFKSAAIRKVGNMFLQVEGNDPRPRRATSRVSQRFFGYALALGLALVMIPSGAWAKATGEVSAQIQVKSPKAADKQPSSEQGYAAREAHAGSVATFEGGDTVVVLGGSALVIILIVVLIIVLI